MVSTKRSTCAVGAQVCIRYSLCLNKDGKSMYTNVLDIMSRDMSLEKPGEYNGREHYGATFYEINEIEAALSSQPPNLTNRPVAPPPPILNHKSTANNLHNGI
eukprot:1192769-Prorocentrum_minimum.AAC.1